MRFEDLERAVREAFLKLIPREDRASKAQIKLRVQRVFVREFQRPPIWKRVVSQIFSHRPTSIAALSLAGFLVFFAGFPLQQSEISAGKILPKYGPVEVVRGADIILVTDEMKLKVGDWVRLGNNSEAEISFPGEFVSTARDRANFRVVEKSALFLESGELENKILGSGKISTDRGFVQSEKGGKFSISVSRSGETRVVNSKKAVSVFDWNDGRAQLKEGEEIALRTDTDLTQVSDVPEDLQLSLSQIMAIRSKLVIARTKVLAGLEESLAGQHRAANRDFVSGEKTFRSIVQILSASRNLEITKRRNLESVQLEEVFARLQTKTSNPKILTETKALETLFQILQQKKGHFAFKSPNSGLSSFDRFVILDRVFALGTPEQRELGGVLKQKYIISILNQIQNEPLRIDQISVLNTEISKLPRTDLAREFVDGLQKVLPPDLAEILAEKGALMF